MAGFGQSDLWQLAGQRYYERGEHYVDAVMDLRDVREGVRATVQDSQLHEVQLSWAGGNLVGDCSCPVGRDDEFCEHCVAVGLVLIDEAEGGGNASGGEPLSEDDLRAYLESLDHEALVDLLCDYADIDDSLHLRLTLRAAGDREAPDVAVLRRLIESSLRIRSSLSYDGGLDYASRAGDIVEALDDLLDAGHAAEVVPLAKLVVDLITEAVERADDSSGEIGSIRDEAAEVYKRAHAEALETGREVLEGSIGMSP